MEARGETPVNAQVCSASRATIREHLAGVLAIPDMRLIVAELEDVAVGFAVARVVRPGLFSDVGWLQVEAIYVAERHRRRGAGHALMATLGTIAVAEDAERVVTMPLTGSRSEQRFLARLGFAAAASHRIAETSSLIKRLEADAVPRERRRPRGLENLIAARRRSREAGAVVGQVDGLPLAAGAESSSRQVNLAVQTRFPDSSVRTIS